MYLHGTQKPKLHVISRETIKKYNQTRETRDKSVLCHAPFVNINFEQNGNMTACCFNRIHVLGTYPKDSIADAWNGKQAEKLRRYIRNNDLGGGCKLCGELINSGNFDGSRAKYFDAYAHAPDHSFGERLKRLFGQVGRPDMPRVFEFEISNTCNLECTMCSGYFSSAIRKNREHLPAIESAYDDAFVDQVAEYLPYLTDLKFLGGEPFLIKLYFDIWKRMIDMRSEARVHITTNGSLFSPRIEDYLGKLNAGIVVSMDSVNPENYAAIRVGSSLDTVLANIEKFAAITRQKKTYLTLAACAMRQNWQDLPDLVRYANDNQFNIHFNIVWNPEHASLRFLSAYDLRDVAEFLKANEPKAASFNQVQQRNVEHYRGVVATVENWMREKGGTAEKREVKAIDLNGRAAGDALEDQLLRLYLDFYCSEGFLEIKGATAPVAAITGGELLARVNEMRQACGDEYTFFKAYMEMAWRFSGLFFPERDQKALRGKIDFVLTEIGKVPDKKEVINEILNSGLISQLDFINHAPKQEIFDTLAAKFYYESAS